MRISDWSSDVCSSDLLLEFSAAEADPPADVFADLGEDSFQCANRLAAGAVSADMVHPDDQSGGEKVRNPECNHRIDPPQCADRKTTRLNSSHHCAPRMPTPTYHQKPPNTHTPP